MTAEAYTPVDFAQELDAIVETRGEDKDEFKTRVKQLVHTARAKGLNESQIRTQLGAKADAMQDALEG
jgi:hypothetical protein